MVQVKAPLLVNHRIARDHYRIRLSAPAIAQDAKPGQFVHIRCGVSGRSAVPLLRRPLSLLDADPKGGTIDLIYKVVGGGTQALSQIPLGAKLDTLGPLGNGFDVPADLKAVYLVGGGVGIPPLYFLARSLGMSCGSWVLKRMDVFLGARTKDWVICAHDFRRLGIRVHVATDDGTLGHKGSVVDLLSLAIARTDPAASLFICGPTPMMKAAGEVARRRRLPAQVSLEERMGCAMGVCMGCVVEVNNQPLGSHTRFQRVCTEGPVFPAQEIVWRNQ